MIGFWESGKCWGGCELQKIFECEKVITHTWGKNGSEGTVQGHKRENLKRLGLLGGGHKTMTTKMGH